MPVQKLKEYLDRHGIKYVTITHSPASTAQTIAAAAHIPGKDLAKTVMVALDENLAMAVLPSSVMVDLERLREAAGAEKARLATEAEFKGLFPECEVGAMPPFGNLWDMEVYVDPMLAKDENIAFNAGSHVELIKLAYQDFARLVRPRTIPLAAMAVGN
jgi:Ala-tRNA(Pro) deacylase